MNNRKKQHRRGRSSLIFRRNRLEPAGISLLEVIVAMALATVLMGAVWTLFQVLTRRQLSEIRQAESNQIRRSLHQRLTRDLNNLPTVIPRSSGTVLDSWDEDYPPGSLIQSPFETGNRPSADSVSINVLVGDQTTLQLAQFVEPVDWNYQVGMEDDDLNDGLKEKNPVLFKKVIYRLPQRTLSQWENNMTAQAEGFSAEPDEDVFASPILVREEVLLEESLLPIVGSGRRSRSEDAPAAELDDEDAVNSNGGYSGGNLNSESSFTRPETLEGISAATFAYHDGTRWRHEWDSEVEGRLPVAIRFRWRQSAIDSAASGDSGLETGDTVSQAAFPETENEIDSGSESGMNGEAGADQSLENQASGWHEGEWIFLLKIPEVSGGFAERAASGSHRFSCVEVLENDFCPSFPAGDFHG